MSAISILITLLVICGIVAAAYWVIGLIPSPPVPPIMKTILQVIVVVFGLLALLGMLTGTGGLAPIHIAQIATLSA